MSLGGILHQSARNDGTGRDEWGTPVWLFSFWDRAIGGFHLDACASFLNRKVNNWYSLENGHDGLKLPWEKWTWCNPPFSQLSQWLDKAIEEKKKGNSSVVIAMARTDSEIFHYARNNATEIYLVEGRVSFLDPETQEPTGSPTNGIVIFLFDANQEVTGTINCARRDTMGGPKLTRTLEKKRKLK